MIPFVTRATHDREMAAKDAEIAGLMARIKRADESFSALASSEIKTAALAADREKTIRRLTARLARFDGTTRQRDARGHFVKDAR